MRLVALTLLATGCKQVFGLSSPELGDAAIDVAVADMAPDARACFGVGLLVECIEPDAQELVVLSNEINTAMDPRCASASDEHCVIAGDMVEIPANMTVVATGARPLVLVARESILIAGTLDVSSRRVGLLLPDRVGAGSVDADECGGAPGVSAGGGGGGGAGGSFGGSGGAGATGMNGNGGAPGTPSGQVLLTSVRGGCRGTRGGSSSSASGAPGGAGGGAAYLIAGSTITVTGMIHAGGMGGYGAGTDAGGGGGGSGGLIVLDAPSVTNAGVLTANGGGGGEGGGGSNNGANGASAIDHTRAADGGANISGGGNGGQGSFAMTSSGGDGIRADGGGGGGGGGAGIIRTYPSQALGGLVSPPAM